MLLDPYEQGLSCARLECRYRSSCDYFANAPARHLFGPITHVLDGGQYLSPGISRDVIEPAGDRTGPLALLDNREFEIYSYLVEGESPHDIARLLNLGPQTVDTYRSSIVRKLEVEGTARSRSLCSGTKSPSTPPPGSAADL